MPSLEYTVVNSLELTKDNSPKLFEDYFDENIDAVVKFCYINEFKLWVVFIGTDIFTFDRLYHSFVKNIFIQAYELSKDNAALQEALKPYIDKISIDNNDVLMRRLDVVSDDMSRAMDHYNEEISLRQMNMRIVSFIRHLHKRTGDYGIVELYLNKLYPKYHTHEAMANGQLPDVYKLINELCEHNGNMVDYVFEQIKETGVREWVEFQFIQRHDIVGKVVG